MVNVGYTFIKDYFIILEMDYLAFHQRQLVLMEMGCLTYECLLSSVLSVSVDMCDDLQVYLRIMTEVYGYLW